MKKCIITLNLALAATCSTVSIAWASGYQFEVQSVRAQGSSNAGSAEAADPSTIFYNPAGLTQLDGSQLVLGGTFVDPHSTFSYSTATNGSNLPVSPASTGGNYAAQAVIPHFYLSHQVNERLVVGIGAFVPFGAKIEYDKDFAGRYYGRTIDFKTAAINPSLGFKLNEHHRIGFGVSAQYLDITLEKSQDLAPVAYGVCMQGGGTQNDCTNAASAYIGLPDAEGKVVTESDWKYGFNLGYQFTPSEDTRIGLAYRSSINHKSDATNRFTVPENLPGGAASPINAGIHIALADGKSTANIKTPETISLNGYHQLNNRWAIMGDWTWSKHSRLQVIEIKMPTEQMPDRKISYKTAWNNSWRASIGASYQLGEKLTLRGGYMYDQTPVSNSSYALTILPDADRQMLSIGTSYRINKHHNIELAYSYLKFKDATIHQTDDDYDSSNGSPGTLIGTYRTDVNLFGLSYLYKF